MIFDTTTPILNIVLGVLLLILGRRLFWIFVSVIGFLVGFTLAQQYLAGQPIWLIYLIAIVAGVIGAGLAVFLQRLAVIIAGFLAGGYLALQLMTMLGVGTGEFSWIPFIVGGIVGAILMAVLFDWAIILLSSLAGASLITQALRPEGQMATLVFIILLIVGVLVQAGLMRREPPETVSR